MKFSPKLSLTARPSTPCWVLERVKTELITALRTAVHALKAGTFPYTWNRSSRCNCGVVACAILGESPGKRLDTTDENFSRWDDAIGAHCTVTGHPTSELFADLFKCGLTALDLIELESLSNPKIAARALAAIPVQPVPAKKPKFRFFWQAKAVPMRKSPRKLNFGSKSALIHYLEAWIEILIEDGQLDGAPEVLTAHEQPVHTQSAAV